ncbi:MAG TPA: hypothetical protein VMD91_19595 [Candidatus Sulfotelmatobacter sp.]|nr:hypothetical protein [Candidatus Sulfotelmatobacter sp.]
MSVEPNDAETAALRKGLRLDLIIAICALVMSTAATGVAWWQTQVIQQELNAQVWPYVSVSSDLHPPEVALALTNNGLGPAVLQSVVVTVDGVSKPDFVAVLHALLGDHIIQRAGRTHGTVGVDFASGGPGMVLRPGVSMRMMHFQSALFAPTLARALSRMNVRTCYCAIVPGECWVADTATEKGPQRVPDCPVIPTDVLHGNLTSVLDRTF